LEGEMRGERTIENLKEEGQIGSNIGRGEVNKN
jgi:hypothetical protein